ncbi:hypothetical protein ApDm4_1675 [Acetobacter pomorum]|nr:hypothetical protein ApDm4_1675 [Acetobacter pomorum]
MISAETLSTVSLMSDPSSLKGVCFMPSLCSQCRLMGEKGQFDQPFSS